ncbi:MAG: leucine-rich repeat domain-containing protein [bacterium]
MRDVSESAFYNSIKILSLFIFLWGYIFAKNDIQCLIDSGNIKNCFLNNGTLQLVGKGLQNLNGIENIPNAESIKIIDLSHNQIKSLNGSLFKRFTNLAELVLNHNLIEQLTSLDDFTNLRELHLTHNRIKTFDLQLFSKLPMLYVLNLGFNEIDRLILKPGASQGDGSTSSPRARLSDALILSLSKDSPAVLADLSSEATRAKGEAIPSEGWAVSGVATKGEAWDPVEGCECLKISSMIKTKENRDFPNLEILFLNNNKIKELPANAFIACPNLQALYLQNNVINNLDNNSFSDLINIRLLYLYDNFITKLPANIFRDLQQLHLLYLRNNNIKTFQTGWDAGLNQLKILDL